MTRVRSWLKSLDYLSASVIMFATVLIASITVWLLVSIGGTLSDLVSLIGAFLASITTFAVAYLAIKWQARAAQREGRDLLLPTLQQLFADVRAVTMFDHKTIPTAEQAQMYSRTLIDVHDRLDLTVALLEHVTELVQPREYALLASLFRLRGLLAKHGELRRQEARIVRYAPSPAEVRVHLSKLREPFTEIHREAEAAIKALGGKPPVVAMMHATLLPLTVSATATVG